MKKTSVLLAVLVLLPALSHAQKKEVVKAVAKGGVKEVVVENFVKEQMNATGKTVVKDAGIAAGKQVAENSLKATGINIGQETVSSAAVDAAGKNVGKNTLNRYGTYTERGYGESSLTPRTERTPKVKSNALENGKITKEQVSPRAGNYHSRAIVEYASLDSEEQGIFATTDGYKRNWEIYNWDKPYKMDPEDVEIPFLPEETAVESLPQTVKEKPLQTTKETHKAAINAIKENIAEGDRIPHRPLFDEPYPTPEIMAIYKRAAREIDTEIRTENIEAASPNALDPKLKEQYEQLVPQMQDLSWRMQQYAQGKAWNSQYLSGETYSLIKKVSELNVKMDALQLHFPFLEKSIAKTKHNIALFMSVVNKRPLIEFDWSNPKPFEYRSFSLNSSVTAGTFSPSKFEMEEATPRTRKDVAARLHKQFLDAIPQGYDKVHIAVINDETQMFEALKEAQKEGLGYIPAEYEIEYFPNVALFFEAHKKHPFNLIYTDCFVPGGSGDMVVQQLRSGALMGKVDQTPIIFNSKGALSPKYVEALHDQGYSAIASITEEEITPETAVAWTQHYIEHARLGKLMPLDFH